MKDCVKAGELTVDWTVVILTTVPEDPLPEGGTMMM